MPFLNPAREPSDKPSVFGYCSSWPQTPPIAATSIHCLGLSSCLAMLFPMPAHVLSACALPWLTLPSLACCSLALPPLQAYVMGQGSDLVARCGSLKTGACGEAQEAAMRISLQRKVD